MPVIDSFSLLKDIYDIPAATYKQSLEELTELLDLSQLLRSPVRQLGFLQTCVSSGNPVGLAHMFHGNHRTLLPASIQKRRIMIIPRISAQMEQEKVLPLRFSVVF